MFLAAGASQLALELISLVFLGGGFIGCGVLWYLMVVRGGREERRQEEARRAEGAAQRKP